MARAGAGAHDRVLVTSAPKSPRQEQQERQRRYLVTMAVRVVCIVLAIVLFQIGLGWAAGVAVAGSLILPWVAVVAANAGPKRVVERPALFTKPSQREIESDSD